MDEPFPFTVTFEYVNVEEHPEHYCCNGVGHSAKPTSQRAAVPDEHWTPVEVGYEFAGDAYQRYLGLIKLSDEDELIRRIRVGGTGSWSADERKPSG